MTQEMLEILIGKYLDSEITPSEQRLLEAELERDPQIKELLRQLQDLHESSSEVVASEITGPGRAAEEVFEQAWQQQSKPSFRFILKRGGHFRFATGVAAGLLIGLILHFVLPYTSEPQDDPVSPDAVVQNTDDQTDIEKPDIPEFRTDPVSNVFRNVDWYSFTDKQGNQWLIEGLREDIVRPAAYSGDL
ncbi:anti-sigma factor family protein [Planctomycetota bacterium]